METREKLEPGKKYKNYTVKRVTIIPELQASLVEIEHEPTGARIMHIVNEDKENAFCISFQTTPTSSNGVAHILEHTVLCGSEKFPIRDPFFSMTRRSLNTYMNAWTGDDFTCYPVATQVDKDFYNLLDVYLDAVFHPKLHELSFKQEGHRLEFSEAEDASTPLEFKGIVYNEMKGAMASAGARLMERLKQLIYPDITYGVNSGGTPAEILTLTHKELCDFHKTYYHPSRGLFYFYGDIPTEKHLDYLEESLLSKYTKLPALPPIPNQKRFDTPIKVRDTYPADHRETPEENSYVTVGWLTCHVLDQEDLLALCLIDSCLMDTDASPLKRALMDSKLCKQVSMTIDPDNAEVPLWVTFRGCNEKDTDALEQLLLDNLAKLAQKGIEAKEVDSALHQLEIHRSEITGDGFPFGLTLFTRAALLKQHGAPPENSLMIHTLFDKVREKILSQPRYLEELIEKYFLQNNHRVTLTMVPEKGLSEKEAAGEKEKLDKIQKTLTDADKTRLVNEAKLLEEFQQAQEDQDENVLPILSLEDIPKESRDLRLDIFADKTLEIFHHQCFTNQIAYVDYAVPLCHVSESELPYIRLLVSLFGQMGTYKRSFMDILTFMHAYTGGAGASSPIYYHTRNHDAITLQFCIRGKALNRNLPKLCELLIDLASGIDFSDTHRLKEIINKQWTSLQSTLTQSSMRYASNLAISGFNVSGKIGYEWYGLGYYYFIKELTENLDSKLPELTEKLNQLQYRLLHGNSADLTVASDADAFNELLRNDYYGLADLPRLPFFPWKGDFSVSKVGQQGRLVSSPVAFTSLAIPTVTYCDPAAPALRIAPFLMDNVVLHKTIREQGGAYGGGASCNLMGGYFSFYGFRDPNINATLGAFDEAVKIIGEGGFSQNDLFEAKLEMIQNMDTPVAPGSRADVAYTWWRESKPYELRQKFRDDILKLTPRDIAEAVSTHVTPFMSEASIVTFSGKELLEKENAVMQEAGKKPLNIMTV